MLHARKFRHVTELQIEIEQQRAFPHPLRRICGKQGSGAFAGTAASAYHRQQKTARVALRRRRDLLLRLRLRAPVR